MKTVCIYHGIDLDGWMSAAIVTHYQEFLNGNRNNHGYNDSLNFIGFNYGNPIPDLSKYDKVIICDISFPRINMEKLQTKLQNNFIWIDHHISAINDIERINEISQFQFNGIRNTKFAACELTWQYFFPNEPMPEIVRLLGRYDCFGHKGTDEETKVLEFQYGARSCISNYEDAYKYLCYSLKINDSNGYYIVEGDIEDFILKQGQGIYQYLCTEAKQAYANKFKINFAVPDSSPNGISHYKGILINKERFNPINFGINYHDEGYDFAGCFHYDGKLWSFSIYNDNGICDVSVICKMYNGGGHKGAAGFRLTNEQFKEVILKHYK